jgi:hypothetical protein
MTLIFSYFLKTMPQFLLISAFPFQNPPLLTTQIIHPFSGFSLLFPYKNIWITLPKFVGRHFNKNFYRVNSILHFFEHMFVLRLLIVMMSLQSWAAVDAERLTHIFRLFADADRTQQTEAMCEALIGTKNGKFFDRDADLMFRKCVVMFRGYLKVNLSVRNKSQNSEFYPSNSLTHFSPILRTTRILTRSAKHRRRRPHRLRTFQHRRAIIC